MNFTVREQQAVRVPAQELRLVSAALVPGGSSSSSCSTAARSAVPAAEDVEVLGLGPVVALRENDQISLSALAADPWLASRHMRAAWS